MAKQPVADLRNIKTGGAYAPNWRHFRPSDVVYVQNPFDYTFVWYVFDEEKNRQLKCSIKPNARAELTGGMIHTLGVKALVDELIQKDNKHLMIYDPRTRAEYEEKVILKTKEAPSTAGKENESGLLEVDLSTDKKQEIEEPEAPKQPNEESDFPDVSEVPNAPEVPVSTGDPLVDRATAGQPDTVVEE